ncbi:hypothetical protein EDB85DRAFT_1888242 [Lactarius pseudohatsudake]|nr:hypothetical protein EDB85DRAFT_1888242 [Lactarius pseudohatsudake]
MGTVTGRIGRLRGDVSTKLIAQDGDTSGRPRSGGGNTVWTSGGGGSDGWAGVGLGGGCKCAGNRSVGGGECQQNVDGEGAGNGLGSDGERMDGGTRGEGKDLCGENTWDELGDSTVGRVEVEGEGIKTQEYAGSRGVGGGVDDGSDSMLLGWWGNGQRAKCRHTSARGQEMARNGDRVGGRWPWLTGRGLVLEGWRRPAALDLKGGKFTPAVGVEAAPKYGIAVDFCQPVHCESQGGLRTSITHKCSTLGKLGPSLSCWDTQNATCLVSPFSRSLFNHSVLLDQNGVHGGHYVFGGSWFYGSAVRATGVQGWR